MSQAIIPTPQASPLPPSLPQQLMAAYMAQAKTLSESFMGSFNRIKAGKADFTMIEAGVERHIPNGQLAGVLLGFAEHDFCTWYEKSYVPGQEPENPDLCWNWPDHNKFPDSLPDALKVKQNMNGVERWAFRIARRSVWALTSVNPETGEFTLNLQNPYILDITSASMFGKSNVSLNEYKWSGLIGYCNRFSQPPNFYCSPAMFLTQILIDMQSPVPGVVVFRPSLSADGQTPQYLDSTTFELVVNSMLSQQVKEMLKVREILDYPKGEKVIPIPPQQVAEPQPAAQPAPQPAMPQPQVQPPVPQPVAQPMAQPAPAPAQAHPAQSDVSLLEQASSILNGMPEPSKPEPEQPVQEEPREKAQARAVDQQRPAKGVVNSVTSNAIDALTDML